MPRKDQPFFGRPLPEVRDSKFAGKLFAIEGADGSGRSTQIAQLSQWLEANGFAVRHMGLRRSNLVAEELEDAKQGNVLTHTTLSLFYATDFFDQLVHEIIPALRAGLIVLADRYLFTALARDAVRGVDRDWVAELYSFAVLPDITFYFRVPLEISLGRILEGRPTLKYHEAGLDMGWSADPYESFRIFQGKVHAEYEAMREHCGFTLIDATEEIHIQQAKVRQLIREKIDLPAYRSRK